VTGKAASRIFRNLSFRESEFVDCTRASPSAAQLSQQFFKVALLCICRLQEQVPSELRATMGQLQNIGHIVVLTLEQRSFAW
jgi:hypothetical protein